MVEYEEHEAKRNAMPARSELIAHDKVKRNVQKQVRHCACVIKSRITEIVLFHALLCAKVFVEQTTKQYDQTDLSRM